jgi:hypothetical protein
VEDVAAWRSTRAILRRPTNVPFFDPMSWRWQSPSVETKRTAW